ncbi:TetR family transcriptional regulator [Ameyamaea chiangmaiensis NBRC 103196]|uniref:TetR family transcriptional regulator n=1 Tax=Ameyamaea chiangmaiensis TaxID=442969 RepID=A0A850PIA4_9PROT|nr:TetR family transcriptional regulator [Ameyamaea chiangmaiensis]MBS4074972.1 TetR family transcriptional regulator [Ameyamaea chiangmaiensis]NVN42130.1 TetR family transcriptional regulator [Ameyamaea chiangmaiensis]GBQ65954.1 TetR family transcriptional regulator [Ameyamaea chiangmaiensis NBRC 103196]
MTADTEHFDTALLKAALELAALRGWRGLTVVDAARDAGLPLDEARSRFPCKAAILMRLGRLADESALRDDQLSGSARERLFDLLMRRIDVFQHYRDGVTAVLKGLPFDPALAALLGAATVDSMAWLARTAGIETTGLRGLVRIKLVVGVWAMGIRAWMRDESEDLAVTMAALDGALDKAARFDLFPTVDMPSHAVDIDPTAETTSI